MSLISEDLVKSFSPSEMKIYEYMNAHYLEISYTTIRNLAKEIGVSTTTIQRFCKKIGYDSFQEFKYAFRKTQQEIITYYNYDFLEILDCLKKLDGPVYKENFNKAIELLGNAESVFFFGIGDSGLTAKYGARRFSSIGKFAVAINDPFYRLNPINSKSVAVIMSVSGERTELVRYINVMKSMNWPIIVITTSNTSTVGKLGDVVIPYYIQRHFQGFVEFTSQVPAIAIIEDLAKMMMKE
ncbi:MAG: MurR/RpiR family transcriptional regulator [Erysipelotrichaceae bacterium]|nr:MurR/RpiR family transcriptional regulator [Erysipelotrichaceae bacterium]